MENKRKLVTLGVILLITYASVVTVYAAPPPPPTQGTLYDWITLVYDYLTHDLTDAITEISDYLTDTLDPKIDDISDNVKNVSTELGIDRGEWTSHLQGYEDVMNVWVGGDLARFTLTVSFYQGDANDNATIFMSLKPGYWEKLAFLNPGADEHTTFSTTVVCLQIKIRAGNENTVDPGADPGQSKIIWAISAVGAPDSPELTPVP